MGLALERAMGDAEGEPGEMEVLDAGSGDHEPEGTKSSGGCGSGGVGGGVSLPPRKRLLVGLKHSGSNNNHSNNGWVAAGAPLSPSSVCPDGLVSMSEGQVLEAAEKKKEREQDEDACVRCGAKETAAWRRVKKDGLYQRLCNSCTLLYMCCPYCLVVYQDVATVGDPSVWLNCCHCRRSVHVECELKSSSGSAPEPSTYVCSECRKNRDLSGKGSEDEGAVVDGAVRPPSSPTSPCSKKARTTTEREKLAEPAKQESVVGRPSPQEDAVTAARDAAAVALKAAATAKATALAKAQAAVKAAMLAKTALENAALAAKGDIRKCTTRMEAAKVKLEEKTKTANSTPEANDEELARQLHRAMNSSTRNSRLPRKI